MDADQIGQILDEIGERVGPAGQYVFEIATRHQLTAGIIGTILWGVVAAFGVAVIAITLKKYRALVNRQEAEYQKSLADYEKAMAKYVEGFANAKTTGRYYSSYEPSRPRRERDVEFINFGMVITFALVPTGLGIRGIHDSVLRALNPQWFALSEIISKITGAGS